MNIPDHKELESRAYAYCQDRNIKVVYNDQGKLFATFTSEEIAKVRHAVAKEILSCIADNEAIDDLHDDLRDLIDELKDSPEPYSTSGKSAHAAPEPTQEKVTEDK